MKAITVWQPWAMLLGTGAKRFETRGWATRYRGPIAIHAGAKRFSSVNLLELPFAAGAAITRALGITLDHLPYGCVIATAELVECWEITGNDGRGEAYIHLNAESSRNGHAKFGLIYGDEYRYGDYSPGRYAWELANVKMLPKPIPAKGAQGLWNWRAA